MKTILLKGEAREELGKASTKQVRKEGKVPCVLYGGKENVNFSVYQADFKNLVYTGNTYKVQIDINGNPYVAILRDLQFHPVSEEIIHADFLEINPKKAVVIDIPINIEGVAPGVRAGGRLIKKYRKLKVKGLIANLPEFVVADINSLELGQSIRVRDIEVKGFEVLDAQENAVISCKMTRAAISAAGGEDAADAEAEEEATEEAAS